jgi:hypothetical protein
MAVAEAVLQGLELYASIGVAVALYFVVFGLQRHGPVSLGARVLLIPAAAGLWPYILKRLLAGPA